jgi:hypothetical protein
MKAGRRSLCCWVLAALGFIGTGRSMAQSSSTQSKAESTVTPAALQREFFDAIRTGDAQKVLSYVAKGVNVGPEAKHVTQDEVDQEFLAHRGLYCVLFDSSCIQGPINLENSARTCSYRELLTHSKDVHLASSEITRNGVRQAVLVARIKNDGCPNQNLIDFVFNLDADGWKLFSIP